MHESAFIESLRALATHPAARGLADDAAVLEIGGRSLVLTHDMLVEGVHYLPSDPPGDVAWKLVAVNLSDLAAKGARPVGVLLGYSLGEGEWDNAFVAGLGAALSAFDLPLLGGDTVRGKGPRTLALTALGEAPGPVPSRAGGKAGDLLWVSGTIGDAGAGLRILKGEVAPDPFLVERYRKPRPRLESGQRLAPLAAAMMDVSDGLLIDSSRLAAASAVGITVELGALPLSEAFLAAFGDGPEARLAAATAGDDYELLFAADPGRSAQILALQEELGLPLSRIGVLGEGSGLILALGGSPVPLPARLGWEHC
ncbi:MAG: thiamine-monophosphate kinase [Sphingomonadales bacterium]|nr:thiamine-monophosphate kinase [Sphingomonadales bacterium]